MAQTASYQPEHLERWSADGPTAFDSRANYAGADMSAFYVAPVSITRDSQTLERSNWHVVTTDIAAVAQHDETDSHCMGHWACGWYEIFLIHESDAAALECADKWAAVLAEYPVASEDHWSELQWDEAAKTWANARLSDRIEWLARFNLSIFAARRDELPTEDNGALFEYLAAG